MSHSFREPVFKVVLYLQPSGSDIIIGGYVKTNGIAERIADCMGDSGEGLVDANTRLQERIEEVQDSRRKAKQGGASLDPEAMSALESLRLARIDLERQLSTTVHEARRLHLQNAVAEVDRRLRDLRATAQNNGSSR